MGRPLRSGYTTGACAAAAAKAAARLLKGSTRADHVELLLPSGDQVVFPLHTSRKDATTATCSIIKDAGDDPDVTNGAELIATVGPIADTTISIIGGAGIGRVTKPGLAVPPGEWAINPVPRRMIEQALREVFPSGGYQVTISIPDGEERAKKTLNARLGIAGGLSILGTTGIVRPISAQAWTDTIDTALDVARACHCPTVVLCTGRSSEQAAMRHYPEFPEESFIMMGDHVAHALQSCEQHGFLQPVLACQFAKLVKIACGHPNTHAAASQMDLRLLAAWLEEAQAPPALCSLVHSAHTARELVLTSAYDRSLVSTVCHKLLAAVAQHAPRLSPAILVCRYDGAAAIPYRPHPR
jgi:cobalt-precorrin-5B (C1)-methyltransferase